MEILIKSRVNINPVNKYGLSPIMIAEKNHFEEIFQILYESGAEYQRKNKRLIKEEEKEKSENSNQKSQKS